MNKNSYEVIREYIDIADDKLNKIEHLYDLTVNSQVNITAIKDKEGYYLKHILDSIYCFKLKPLKFTSVGDIGSGGGFPGLVIAIMYPETKVTLIESIGKKCRYLESAVESLDLKNVTVINERAESVKGLKFDLVTARGVSAVKELVSATSNLVHDKSVRLLYKGSKLDEELKLASAILRKEGLISEQIRVETPITRTYCYIHR